VDQLSLPQMNERPTFQNRQTKDVTFRGKLTLPIHRWYRLTPSFSPSLADDIATHFKLTNKDLVLDPFSGVGTVPLTMKYRGIPACSVEINPYLYFVSTVKTRTYSKYKEIAESFQRFRSVLEKAFKGLPATPTQYLIDNESFIPRISNPTRWWSPSNLMQLVCLRKCVQDFKCTDQDHDLIKMASLAILIPCSNAKHNHVSLTFADKPQDRLDVFQIFCNKLDEMYADLEAVKTEPCADVSVYYGNSKELASALPKDKKPTAVITSPPYPNRFSYARETRPHLFFFDLIEDAAAVGELETNAIGGTWGKATSVLLSGTIKPNNDCIDRLLKPHLDAVAGEGSLMASYVVKYFNDLYDHAQQVSVACADNCQLAYVIGNSKFFGNPLPSDEILGHIFSEHGFQLDSIERMRKRQSKAGLYEAVVFMSRSKKKGRRSR
jgi:hypothetical protein